MYFQQHKKGSYNMFKKTQNLFYKFAEYLNKTLMIIAGLFFGSTFIILSIQVFLRNSPLKSFLWAEEFSRYVTIYFVMLGLPIAGYYDEQPKVDILFDYISEFKKKILIIIANISGIIFSYFLTREGISLVTDNLSTRTPSLRLAWAIPYSSILVGSGLLMLLLIVKSFLNICEMLNYMNKN